jgi:hypothetical protein
VKNAVIKFVRVFARCPKVHIICSVLISGILQHLATISSWKVPDDTTFTVHSVSCSKVCGSSADFCFYTFCMYVINCNALNEFELDKPCDSLDFILIGCHHTDCVRHTPVMSLGDKCSCAVCKAVVKQFTTNHMVLCVKINYILRIAASYSNLKAVYALWE